jgi:hypothetical protein
VENLNPTTCVASKYLPRQKKLQGINALAYFAKTASDCFLTINTRACALTLFKVVITS